MSRTIHVCMSVRGMLQWDSDYARRMMRSIKRSDGSSYANVREFRNALMDELKAGHEVLPIGKRCEGFDDETGCPGHEV